MEITNYLKENIVTCVKYHYQLDNENFGSSSNHGFIELTTKFDSPYLNFYNRKKQEKDEYILKNYPIKLQEEREQYLMQRGKILTKLQNKYDRNYIKYD